MASAPASRKASVAPSMATSEPAPAAQPSRQPTTASPEPAPAQEVKTIEIPMGAVVTTEQVTSQAGEAAQPPVPPSVKSSVKSARKSAKSSPAPAQTVTMPPPTKVPTTYVAGEIPQAPPQPTAESATTSVSSMPPPVRPAAVVNQEPKIQITAGTNEKPLLTVTKQPNQHMTSSSDWERPQPRPNYQPQVRYEQEPLSEDPNAWETSFFGCLEHMSSCLMGYCIPCVLYSRAEHRMKEPSLETWSPLDGNTALSCIANCLCPGIAQCLQRRKIRKRYSLRGEDLTDVVYSFCCPCCAQVQNDNEVRAQHEVRGAQEKQLQYSNRSAAMTYGTSSTSS